MLPRQAAQYEIWLRNKNRFWKVLQRVGTWGSLAASMFISSVEKKRIRKLVRKSRGATGVELIVMELLGLLLFFCFVRQGDGSMAAVVLFG